MHSKNIFGLAASLALITVLGPSAIDMYLASMPDMARSLNTPFATVQLTLMVFLLAMGAGQLLFGPLVDAYGRRRPLLYALLAFIVASILASAAPSIHVLLLARLAQGLAAALTLVVAMSTVRDVSEGAKAAQLFALLMTIQGLAPVLAPAVGGYVDVHFGWRGVMLVLAMLGGIALINSLINLPETLPVHQRAPLRLRGVLATYVRIAVDGRFLLPALALTSVFFFLFAYIGGATLVYQTHYGLTPETFGLVFGGTGCAVLVGAVLSSRLVAVVSIPRLAWVGAGMMTVGAAIAASATAMGLPLASVVAGLAIAMLGLGVAEATLMSLAMASQRQSLGSTAALLGGMQMSISSTATPLAGRMAESGASAWTMFLLGCGITVLALTTGAVMRVVSPLRSDVS